MSRTRIERVMPPKMVLRKSEVIAQIAAGFERQFQSPFPKLELVADYYFGTSVENAMAAHAQGRLPINVYRLGGRKSTPVISVLELAHLAYERLQEGQP